MKSSFSLLAKLPKSLKCHYHVQTYPNFSSSFSSRFAVPSHPRNVTVHEVTSATIKISWLEPDKPNGPNLMYRIYYTSLNQTHLAMPKNDPENGMRSDSGVHYYTLKKLRKSQMMSDSCTIASIILINFRTFY